MSSFGSPPKPLRSTANILMRGTIYSFFIIGGGYLILKFATPTSEQLEAELRKRDYRIDSPEVQRQKTQAMYANLKAVTERDVPIWMSGEERREGDRNRPDIELKRK